MSLLEEMLRALGAAFAEELSRLLAEPVSGQEAEHG